MGGERPRAGGTLALRGLAALAASFPDFLHSQLVAELAIGRFEAPPAPCGAPPWRRQHSNPGGACRSPIAAPTNADRLRLPLQASPQTALFHPAAKRRQGAYITQVRSQALAVRISSSHEPGWRRVVPELSGEPALPLSACCAAALNAPGRGGGCNGRSQAAFMSAPPPPLSCLLPAASLPAGPSPPALPIGSTLGSAPISSQPRGTVAQQRQAWRGRLTCDMCHSSCHRRRTRRQRPSPPPPPRCQRRCSAA